MLIVGYGSIGAAVERRLAGFEVSVLRVARTARPEGGVAPVSDLPGLLPAADVVVLLAPVTAETIGMVDAAFLARMKDGALLVNAARGSLVVTDALVAEARSGRLRMALDVTDPEPLPPGHPLWDLPGVFITPHEGASTPVSVARMAAYVRDQAETVPHRPAAAECDLRQLLNPRRDSARSDVARWTLFLNRSVT